MKNRYCVLPGVPEQCQYIFWKGIENGKFCGCPARHGNGNAWYFFGHDRSDSGYEPSDKDISA